MKIAWGRHWGVWGGLGPPTCFALRHNTVPYIHCDFRIALMRIIFLLFIVIVVTTTMHFRGNRTSEFIPIFQRWNIALITTRNLGRFDLYFQNTLVAYMPLSGVLYTALLVAIAVYGCPYVAVVVGVLWCNRTDPELQTWIVNVTTMIACAHMHSVIVAFVAGLLLCAA